MAMRLLSEAALQHWLARCAPHLRALRVAAAYSSSSSASSSSSSGLSSAVASPGRDSMKYDVCIVGAGPAGLSAGIKLKQVEAARQ